MEKEAKMGRVWRPMLEEHTKEWCIALDGGQWLSGRGEIAWRHGGQRRAHEKPRRAGKNGTTKRKHRRGENVSHLRRSVAALGGCGIGVFLCCGALTLRPSSTSRAVASREVDRRGKVKWYAVGPQRRRSAFVDSKPKCDPQFIGEAGRIQYL